MKQKDLNIDNQSLINHNQEKDLYGIDKEMSLQSVKFATTENPYFYENFREEE